MRPIVNMPEEDLATDIRNMHKNLVKIAHVVPEISVGQTDTDTQTHRQTHSSLTVLLNRSRERSNNFTYFHCVA